MAEIHFQAPMVFAHRGASAYAPENTLSSFRLAVELSAPAIEFDVKLTGDGEVVVLHDQTLDRTTDGYGDVRQFTLSQLRKLDAGARFDPKFHGEKIPTLREVFDLFGSIALLNIELTNYASPQDDLVTRVVSLVKQFHIEEYVLFSSFNPGTLIQARRMCPEVPIGLLSLLGWRGWLFRSSMNFWIPCEALHPHVTDISPEMIDRQHRLGKRVHTWTVNSEESIRRMFEYGVDGIFTDDPKLALCVLEDVA